MLPDHLEQPNGQNVVAVEIRESDLSKSELDRIKLAQDGTQLLGAAEALKDVMNEVVISVAIRKLKSLVPEGFTLTELEMSVKLEGKLFGSGVSGEVKAKLVKRL